MSGLGSLICMISLFAVVSRPINPSKFKKSSDALMSKVQVQENDAVCNDGTPAVFYFSEGDPNTWLVYLEGGAWCWDEATCASRWDSSPQLMSSISYKDSESMGGIFSSDPSESPMSSATKVHVKYCSSDAFGGDIAASTTTFGWSFRGKRIVESVFAQLVSDFGLLSTEGNTTIYFGGTSAGGRGAMFHLDSVAQFLSTESDNLRARNRRHATDVPSSSSFSSLTGTKDDPSGVVNVLGLLDSPLWMDIQPLYDDLTPLQVQTESIRELANITSPSVVSAECDAVYPAAEEEAGEPWKCLYGQYRIDFLETRYLVFASSFDAFQLEGLIGHYPASEEELEFAEYFANATRAKLQELHVAASSPQRQPLKTQGGLVTSSLGVYSQVPRASIIGLTPFDPLAISPFVYFPSLNVLRRTIPVPPQACYNHAISASPLFSTTSTEDGATEATALAAFITQGYSFWDIDQCTSLSCGSGCVTNEESAISGSRSSS